MNHLAPSVPIAAHFALFLGALLLAFTTYSSARRGAGVSSFGWALIAGLSCSILAMAAALRFPESLGLAAALAQLFCVALAAVLGFLCAPRPTVPTAGAASSGRPAASWPG